jgi:hypothetical protein
VIAKRVFQRCQRPLLVVQSDAHDRMKPIGDIIILRDKLLQCVLGFAAVPSTAECVRKGRLRERIARTHARGGTKRRNRFLMTLKLHERLSETKVQLVPSRLEFHGFTELRNRFVKTPPVIQGPADFLDRNDGEGVEDLRMAVRRHRLVAATGIPQANSASPIDICIAGREFDGQARLRVCRTPIPIIEQTKQAERSMSLGKLLVQGNRLDRRGLGFRKRLLRLHPKEISQLDKTFGNAGVGRCIVRIGLN